MSSHKALHNVSQDWLRKWSTKNTNNGPKPNRASCQHNPMKLSRTKLTFQILIMLLIRNYATFLVPLQRSQEIECWKFWISINPLGQMAYCHRFWKNVVSCYLLHWHYFWIHLFHRVSYRQCGKTPILLQSTRKGIGILERITIRFH